MPLGLTLNNPGNLELGQPWKGLAEVQKHSRFCTFISAEYGIRAMAKLLSTYKKKYGINTLDQAIAKYAPPTHNGKVENDTGAYVRTVSKLSGFARGEKLDFSDAKVLEKIIPAMIKVEQGQQPFPKELIAEAVRMALA